MSNRHVLDGPEPTLPAPPGQIPGIAEMGDGHYINHDLVEWQKDHGLEPNLKNYPPSAIALFKHVIKTGG